MLYQQHLVLMDCCMDATPTQLFYLTYLLWPRAPPLSRLILAPQDKPYFTAFGGPILTLAGVTKQANVPALGAGERLLIRVRVPAPALSLAKRNDQRYMCLTRSPDFLKGRFMRKRTSQGHWIYTAYITLRNGRVIYAYQYGLRAFRIWVTN